VDTGEPVPDEIVRQVVDSLIDAAEAEVAALTEDLYAGDITVDEWEAAVAQTLKDAHIAQAALGRGGMAFMTPDDLLSVEETLQDELTFLDKFGQDIVLGTVSLAMAIQRINQYGNASQQSYWQQWNEGIDRQHGDELRGLHPLTRMPGDGSTECRGHCRCYLIYDATGIDWITTAQESCVDCIDMRDSSPWGPMI
jgi:hypothetical protein